MPDKTPRFGLDRYSRGEPNWNHTDTVNAVDEYAIARGPIDERPSSGEYDDELYYALDQRILWGWNDSENDWEIYGGLGTEEDPLPRLHASSVDTGQIRSNTSTSNSRRFTTELSSRGAEIDLREVFETRTVKNDDPFQRDTDNYVTALYAGEALDDPIDEFYAYTSGYRDSTIHLYTAPHPEGPWTYQGGVVDNEGADIDKPRALYNPVAEEIQLFYTADDSGDSNIDPADLAPMLATTPAAGDGTEFTIEKRALLDTKSGRFGRFDDHRFNHFSVLKCDHEYVATYFGGIRGSGTDALHGFGVAWSEDLENWTRLDHPFGWHQFWENADGRTRQSATPSLIRIGTQKYIFFSEFNSEATYAFPLEWMNKELGPEDRISLSTAPKPTDTLEHGAKTYLFGGGTISSLNWEQVIA